MIFLGDAFARYIEPETGQAALDILSDCGYEVHVLPVTGAGASFLSKGFLDQARSHAKRVLDLIEKIDPGRQAPVVAIEPPEIYALKHDYADLLPERAAEIIARVGNVWLLDEFLLRSDKFHDLRIVNMSQDDPSKRSDKRTLRFHPHCHQRAEGPSPDGLPNGTMATVELLRICGYDVELMDTGCCGMAGTFGYEAEHYEVSMKVGELKLFPLLRPPSEPPSTPGLRTEGLSNTSRSDLREVPLRSGVEGVVSTGAACRMQIRQGTGVEALHPVMLVRDFVRSRSSIKT